MKIFLTVARCYGYAFFLPVFLISIFGSVHAKADWVEKVAGLHQKTDMLREEILGEGLSLLGTRPKQCPVEAPTFRDLADKMAAISASLTVGKCYEKHAKLIAEINQLAHGDQGRQAFDTTPAENGSFIENNPQTVINITNTQIQSVQNNGLIGGLFSLSKDKDCLELLRKRGNLTLVAEVLTKFGAIGFFVPSTVGMIGSAAIMAAGGALFMIDKLIQPSFTWHIPQDRKDFMALTCSFFNIRTQLHQAGFFDSPNSNLDNQAARLESFKKSTLTLLAELDQTSRAWQETYSDDLKEYLRRTDVPASRSELFLLLSSDLEFLRSVPARGQSPEERLEVVSHFLRQMRDYRTLLRSNEVNRDYAEKTLTTLEELVGFTLADVQRLTLKTWQLAYITGLEHLFKALKETDLKDVLAQVQRFEQENGFSSHLSNAQVQSKITIEQRDARQKLSQLNNELSGKLANIQRLKSKISLSSQDEGAQSEFDLYREFSAIKSILLGKKGWTFVAFLIRDAKQHMRTFNASYPKWQATFNSSDKRWTCRNAFSLSTHWSEANAAVELAYDYLGANNDILSDYYSRIEWALKVVPIGQSYTNKMVRAAKSAEKAKEYLAAPTPGLSEEIKGLRSTVISNLGAIILVVKENELQKQELDEFRHKNCIGITEF